MTDPRQFDGPSTPASTVTFPSVVKPADGDITFTATITRDPADAGPTPVTIKDSDGNVLGSLTLTTPAGTQDISITVSNSVITQCCVIPTASCETPIQTDCCENSVPSKLTVTIGAYISDGDYQPLCEECLGAAQYPPPINGTTFAVHYDVNLDRWTGETTVCGVTIGAQVYCFGSTFAIDVLADGEMINNATLNSGGDFFCSPFFGLTSDMRTNNYPFDCTVFIATVAG